VDIHRGEFHGIPDDVILANCLELKCLNAQRAASYLAVPKEKAGREGLTIDFRPAGWVDEKAEHVLLSTIEPGRTIHAALRRLEVSGEFP
jgi:hypothetical protein